MLNESIINRFRIAPVNSQEIKYNIFAPLLKISNNEKYKNEFVVYEDNDFIVKLQGTKLTQIHKDILDITFFYGKNYKKDNLFGKAITLYAIQKKLNYKKKNNHKWIINKLEELKRTNIQIIRKQDKAKLEFSILRATIIDPIEKQYAILIEELYLMFFESFISVNYKPLLDKVLNLENGTTKAIVRYLFTFKEHQINIDKLLKRIGVNCGQRTFEKHRKATIEELKKYGNLFGIEVIPAKFLKDYVIKYKKPAEIKFYHPVQLKK